MITTYRYLVESVIEAINEAKDDADIRKDLVVFWTQVEVNRLRGERFSKRYHQSGEYLNHFYGIQVQNDGVRKYVELPSGIIDVEADNAIHMVTYHLADYEICEYPYDVTFERTSPARLWSLMAIPIRKPSAKKPYYAREYNKLFFYGIENINVETVDLWLYTTVSTKYKLNLDEEVELSEEQISILLQRVLNLARFASLYPNDKTNNGSDNNNQSMAKTAVSQTSAENQPQQ